MIWRSVIVLLCISCRTSTTVKLEADDGVITLNDADGDGFFNDEDCDDGSPFINPSMEEICDGLDNNCDGNIDEGVTQAWYLDADEDGYGTEDDIIESCSSVDGRSAVSGDCSDLDADSYPGAPELCDDIDNDCDDQVDEDIGALYYLDQDEDGFGDDSETVFLCESTSGYAEVGSDCDDQSDVVYPGAPELCDDVDNDCDAQVDEDIGALYYLDQDGDGFGDSNTGEMYCAPPENHVSSAGDCDDIDPLINPNAQEVCDDNADNNCDGNVNEIGAVGASRWYLDADGDGYGEASSWIDACDAPVGLSGNVYVSNSEDCDDGDPIQFPNAPEYCNGEDDDCDQGVDEQAVDLLTWYLDADGDGEGTTAPSVTACDAPIDPTSGNVYVDNADDCDDTESTVYSTAVEGVDDGIDQNCDGAEECYVDSDADGYASSSLVTIASQDLLCGNDAQEAASGAPLSDCNDFDPAVNPSEDEVCDAIDHDCDGSISFNAINAIDWYLDQDGDGYGTTPVVSDCFDPSTPSQQYVLLDNDCDDADGTINPSEPELCDLVDQNCDGNIDEGVLGVLASCPAESCAEIISFDSLATDGDYWLEEGVSTAVYTCDMTTDGGGWTQVLDWNRVDNGDTKADFLAHLSAVYNNMTVFQNSGNSLFWHDSNGNGDVLAFRKDIAIPNAGEVLYNIQYTGGSMERSGTFFYVENSGNNDVNLECMDDVRASNYSNAELSYLPSFTCPSQTVNASWSGAAVVGVGSEALAFHLRSFHHDTCCDYSYLYKLEGWIR